MLSLISHKTGRLHDNNSRDMRKHRRYQQRDKAMDEFHGQQISHGIGAAVFSMLYTNKKSWKY